MITVFTPTYNRAGLLNRLYNSLISQTSKDFEWIIVDDGSIDDTKEVCQFFIDENIIKIKYFFQENSGKHIAINNGVKNASGELFLCVDSDDMLTNNAIDLLLKTWNSIQNSDLAGIIALKNKMDNSIIGDVFPNSLTKVTTFELSEKYGCGGDKCMIYRTDILKSYPYPQITNEKFVTECVVFDQIATKKSMWLLNESICICEYQINGLTSNIFSTMLQNPIGYKIYYKQRIDMAYTFKQRFGFIIRYNAFNIMSNEDTYNYTGKHKILVSLSKPIGFLIVKYYKIKKRLK